MGRSRGAAASSREGGGWAAAWRRGGAGDLVPHPRPAPGFHRGPGRWSDGGRGNGAGDWGPRGLPGLKTTWIARERGNELCIPAGASAAQHGLRVPKFAKLGAEGPRRAERPGEPGTRLAGRTGRLSRLRGPKGCACGLGAPGAARGAGLLLSWRLWPWPLPALHGSWRSCSWGCCWCWGARAGGRP